MVCVSVCLCVSLFLSPLSLSLPPFSSDTVESSDALLVHKPYLVKVEMTQTINGLWLRRNGARHRDYAEQHAEYVRPTPCITTSRAREACDFVDGADDRALPDGSPFSP